jgi:cobalt/nickel transport system permease protein
VLVMVASFAYRYIFVLVDEAERMERARDSRCYGGRWLWHARVIGQMIGTLFLRGYERSERVYVAMVSRGFDGRIVAPAEARMAAGDYAFVAASVGFFVALRVLA